MFKHVNKLLRGVAIATLLSCVLIPVDAQRIGIGAAANLWNRLFGTEADTTFERYYATNTFRLGSTGVTIAEIDTSANPGDTIRFYITGSNQPQTIDTTLNIALDTSLKVGTSGVTWDSITLSGGEIWWWSNGQDFNISDVIYTTPTAPTTLTISSPDSDTLTYSVSIFPSPANGTVSDSCMVRWDTAAIPTAYDDGYQVYYGDTSVAETDFFIDMADSLEVYVSAFSGNGGAYASTIWSVAKTDSVWIDNTDAGYNAIYQPIHDTLTAWGVPPHDTIADIFNDMMYELDTAMTTEWSGRSILDTLDGMYWFASQDSSALHLEWINRLVANKLVLNGNITWDKFEGTTGGGTSSDYGETGWDPANDAVNYQTIRGFIALYNHETVEESSIQVGNTQGRLAVDDDAGNHKIYGRINQTASTTSGNDGGGNGFVAVDRKSATEIDLYRTGTKIYDGSNGMVAFDSDDWYVHAYNSSGTAGSPSTKEISNIFWGGTLGDTGQEYLNIIVERAMDRLNTGVQ